MCNIANKWLLLLQVQASHLLVKHRESRRPSSWKEKTITRSKEEALEMIKSNYMCALVHSNMIHLMIKATRIHRTPLKGIL